jgi:hypothetical protein
MTDPIRRPRAATLEEVADEIRDADLLLWRRGQGLVGRLIAACGRGIYSHAAMAAWIDGDLVSLETVQFRGARARRLADQVARHPGRIDLYRTNAAYLWDFDPSAAVDRMRAFLGCDYGWWSLWRAGLWHLPFVRLFVRPELDDEANGSPVPFCSQAVSIAYRAGGVDPVPRLADRLTEPQDLARSLFFDYLCTLV